MHINTDKKYIATFIQNILISSEPTHKTFWAPAKHTANTHYYCHQGRITSEITSHLLLMAPGRACKHGRTPSAWLASTRFPSRSIEKKEIGKKSEMLAHTSVIMSRLVFNNRFIHHHNLSTYTPVCHFHNISKKFLK